MKKEQAIEMIISILKQVQADLGEEPEEITPTTVPIGGIQGFDSLVGVVVTVSIAQAFDLPDDEKLDKLFLKNDPQKGPTFFNVSQIADKILALKQG
jgi:acyl carrier protein